MILEKNKEEEKLPELKLENLIYIRNIGRGQFGEVFLVEDEKQNRYAVKTVSKAKVHSLCLDRHVQVMAIQLLIIFQEERKVLKMVKFPFIMEFYRTFKDMNNVYFLTEFINGMDLFDVIRELGKFRQNFKLISQDYLQKLTVNFILEV